MRLERANSKKIETGFGRVGNYKNEQN